MELTPQQLFEVEFSEQWRGYNRDEVDDFIERVAAGVAALQDHLRQMTERAMFEAAAGRIAPVIGRTFPLEKAADAHAAIENRLVIGKTLLLTGSSE